MGTRLALVTMAVLTALVTSLAAHGATTSATKICGQITNGPHASYWSLVSGIKLEDGTTWTVLATGVGCATAVQDAKRLLPVWKGAKLGARLPLAGFTCVKMVDRSYSGRGKSSGGGLCHVGTKPATSVFSPGTFAFRMTGAYTAAQIKAFFHLG